METLSAASVSTINLPSLPPPPHPPLRSISHRFKATASTASTNLSKPSQTFPNPTPSSSSHNKSPKFSRSISSPLPHVISSRSPPVHDKAASGFAAALVSVSQAKNCLGRTQEDVRRLMKFLVGEGKKRNKVLVNDVSERGKLGKHLKGLVKMLIAKGKSEILVDVLIEFERICNELVVDVGTTTKLVWVS